MKASKDKRDDLHDAHLWRALEHAPDHNVAPDWRMSIRTATALSDTLKKMGMRTPFNRTAADFYGISDYPRSDLYHRLHISAVLHQAVIKVAEKGTEAAAATAIIDQGGGGGEPPPTIRIDHPFVWLIRDRDTGTILFMGRVMDPSQTAK